MWAGPPGGLVTGGSAHEARMIHAALKCKRQKTSQTKQ